MDSFDLRGASSADARTSRSVRIVSAALAIGFALMAAWFVTLASSPDGLHDTLQWIVFVGVESGLLPMTGLLAYGVWKLGPGATSMVVGNGRVQFGWKSGRTDVLTWSELTRGFVLLDYSANPVLPRYTPYLWEARRWKRPATKLTREAFDAILKVAKEQGLWARSNFTPRILHGLGPMRHLHTLGRPDSPDRLTARSSELLASPHATGATPIGKVRVLTLGP